jgi:hypothetical protein
MSEIVGTSYSRMVEKGKIRRDPLTATIRAAGTSTAVFDDSVGKDIQPDIYFPIAEKPAIEADARIAALKELRHGLAYAKGETTEKALKAGMRSGVEEYLESFKERVYRSHKMEPLDKPFIRGFDIPEGVVAGGSTRVLSLSAKESLFPRDSISDTQADHEQYVFTHQSFAPGEQVSRDYAWPAEVHEASFAFGQPNERNKGGTKDALVWERNTEPTKIALKRLDEYRQVTRDHLGKSKNTMRNVPPADLRFGIRSTSSSNTAAQCLHFNVKDVSELLADADLGRAKRRLPETSRVFGVPSVRTDIPKPATRGLADIQNYGDDPGAATLLNPQRFENMGVYDEDFSTPLLKAAIRTLLPSLLESDFEATWAALGSGTKTATVQEFLRTYGESVVAARIQTLDDVVSS